MWNKYGHHDDFSFEKNVCQTEQAAAKSRSQREDAARREREAWDHFVLEINNVIPGPLNDPSLFDENDW